MGQRPDSHPVEEQRPDSLPVEEEERFLGSHPVEVERCLGILSRGSLRRKPGNRPDIHPEKNRQVSDAICFKE